MKLLEILDTSPNVKWSESDGYRHFGKFKLDNDDIEYSIQLDEYEALGLTVVDFGFTANGSIMAVNSNKSASKIIGAVVNGSKNKIKKINPDVILVSVMKESGLVESRMSLYTAILKWVSRSSGFTYQSDWVENSKTFVKIAAKKTPSDEHLAEFFKYARLK